MTVFGFYASGTRPNFFPGPGLSPFLADFVDAQAGVTFRPMSRLLLDETYIYSGLSANADHLPPPRLRRTSFDARRISTVLWAFTGSPQT